MAYVTPTERRVLMDVYNMTDANIAALDPGIAERLISSYGGGLVYDIIADDPNKPVIATTLGELNAQDFVGSATQSAATLSQGLKDAAEYVASLPGRAADALGETAKYGAITMALVVVVGFWWVTRK